GQSRHPPLCPRYSEARRGRAYRQYRLGRRFPEPPRHQPGTVFDEQIRGSVTVRSTGARVGRHQCRRLGAVPGPGRHEYPAWRPQPPRPLGGPQIRADDEAVLAGRLATTGLDPNRVGERVVDAIRTKTFYA